jgi:hypothetical protein
MPRKPGAKSAAMRTIEGSEQPMLGMFRRINRRTATIIVALLAAVGLAFVASGSTNAYFEDVKQGGVTGTIGQVKISTEGGNAIDQPVFTWDDMLPGEPNSLTVKYTNKGTVPEDVWLMFPNLTALSALNSLGTYGSVTVSVNGTQVYANSNLNDKPNNGTTGLPAQLKLQEHLAVNHSGTFTFSFTYADKLGGVQGAATHSTGGGVFNTYPVPGQVTVRSGDGSGNGLPFAVAGVQENHQP